MRLALPVSIRCVASTLARNCKKVETGHLWVSRDPRAELPAVLILAGKRVFEGVGAGLQFPKWKFVGPPARQWSHTPLRRSRMPSMLGCFE